MNNPSKPKLAPDKGGSGPRAPRPGGPIQIYEADFNEYRLRSFPIVIQRVTWLGRADEPPNRVVTIWIRAYVYERTALTRIMVQLDSESVISWADDHYLNRWLEKCLPELCQVVRDRLAVL